MSNVVKAESKEEARRQLIMIDKSLADTITRRLEIEERRKVLNEKLRATKEYEELRSLAKEDKELIVIQHEKNGARKMLYGLLKRFGIEMPETKLTRLADKNNGVRALVEAR